MHYSLFQHGLPVLFLSSHRGVAQFGSASALGAEGRRFESGRPDHTYAGVVQLAERQASILEIRGFKTRRPLQSILYETACLDMEIPTAPNPEDGKMPKWDGTVGMTLRQPHGSAVSAETRASRSEAPKPWHDAPPDARLPRGTQWRSRCARWHERLRCDASPQSWRRQ